jgi:hypothetical protein
MGWFSKLMGGGGETGKTIVQQRLPEEISPYVKDVLKDTKTLYQQRMGEGYDPYTGQRIAGLTPQQQQAMTGIEGLVGTQAPMMQEAITGMRGGQEQFTPEAAQQYMSPYQQAVIDVEKRKAQEDFEQRLMPQFEKQAVEAGGMSGMGSRAGVQAAIMGGQQAQRLGDIQTKGLQSAYLDARRGFEQQKQRERLAATDIAKMAPELYGAQVKELSGLQQVGEAKQGLTQQGLDKSYADWLEARQFPEEQLARYQSSIYGNPLLKQMDKTTTTSVPGMGLGKSLAGLGMYGLMKGGFGNPMKMIKKAGGYIGGLSSLPVVRRATNGSVSPPVDFLGLLEKAGQPAAYGDLLTPREELLETQKKEQDRIRKLLQDYRPQFSPGAFLSAFSKPGAGLVQALGAEGMATEKKQAEFDKASLASELESAKERKDIRKNTQLKNRLQRLYKKQAELKKAGLDIRKIQAQIKETLAKIGIIKPLTETDYKRLVKAMGEKSPGDVKTSHYARDIISKHLDNEGSVVRKTILENLGYKSSDNIAGAKDYIEELLKNQVFRTSVISQYQKMKPLYPGKTMAELLIHSVVDTLKQYPLHKPIKKSRPKGTL